MLETLLSQINVCLDHVTGFLWNQFQKDMDMTNAILNRTEAVWARVEVFFSGSRRGR